MFDQAMADFSGDAFLTHGVVIHIKNKKQGKCNQLFMLTSTK